MSGVQTLALFRLIIEYKGKWLNLVKMTFKGIMVTSEGILVYRLLLILRFWAG